MKKVVISVITVLVIIAVGVTVFFVKKSNKKEASFSNVTVERKDIKETINETGTVTSMNLITVPASIAGRVEKIRVKEGNNVKVGDILFYISSDVRTSLIDGARSSGKEAIKEIEDMYPLTPIQAPVSGKVVSLDILEGQTVNANTEACVISDRLIIVSKVDEVNIGKIRSDLKADVKVDAFSDKKFKASVYTIGFKSESSSGINMYKVKLIFDKNQDTSMLKEGMGCSVDFILNERNSVLALPTSSVDGKSNTTTEVMDKDGNMVTVQLGISDGEFVEIVNEVPEDFTVRVKNFYFDEVKRKASFMGGR